MNSLLRPITQPLEAIGGLVWLFIDTCRETTGHMLRGHVPFRADIFFRQADRVGYGSVPLVTLISFFLGLTMALLVGYELRKFGSQNLVPGLVGVAFTRELGPLMTGIVVAARIGAAYTAELGTMTVSEEVEAIEAMGIGPLRYLVAPRVLAVFLLMPCLAVIANLAALAGAAIVCNIQLQFSYLFFIQRVLDNLIVRDIVAGELKSFLFGAIIGLISCYKGLAVHGGSAGVGDATTSSVVTAVTTVIAADTLFNIALVAFYE
jgi:phospholipid/cholesterol/gamma-HCH transport system permease protein